MEMYPSILGQLLGPQYNQSPYACGFGDPRAISEQEMAARMQMQSTLLANAKPTLQQILGMANYRPQIIVPGGWANWYEMANEII